MSTESNIQIVQKAYADFGRGDVPAILEVLDENVEWISPGKLPESGTWRGHAGVLKFFQLVGANWDFQAFEPRDFIASGDQVAAVGSYTATSRGTGRQASAQWVMVWKFRGGKVTNFQEYTDTGSLERALAAGAVA